MIAVEIINVVLSDEGFLILLKSDEDNRVLPIYIGKEEARSILIALSNTKLGRPLTHDLMKNLLEELSCSIVRVEVSELKDETFFGRIILEHNGLPMEIDSRPSDAIALAVRAKTPIFVDPKVMEEAGVLLQEDSETGNATLQQPKKQSSPDAPQNSEPEAELSPLEKLKKQLQQAIETEQYEEAARLRDAIRKITTSN